MGVDQAWKKRQAAQLNHARPGRHRHLIRRPDPLDSVAFHDHDPTLVRPVRNAIEKLFGSENHGARRLGGGTPEADHQCYDRSQ